MSNVKSCPLCGDKGFVKASTRRKPSGERHTELLPELRCEGGGTVKVGDLPGLLVKEKWPTCRIIYKVEKVDTYNGKRYALLTWVKRGIKPGAMWVELKALITVFLKVGDQTTSGALPASQWEEIEVES